MLRRRTNEIWPTPDPVSSLGTGQRSLLEVCLPAVEATVLAGCCGRPEPARCSAPGRSSGGSVDLL